MTEGHGDSDQPGYALEIPLRVSPNGDEAATSALIKAADLFQNCIRLSFFLSALTAASCAHTVSYELYGDRYECNRAECKN